MHGIREQIELDFSSVSPSYFQVPSILTPEKAGRKFIFLVSMDLRWKFGDYRPGAIDNAQGVIGLVQYNCCIKSTLDRYSYLLLSFPSNFQVSSNLTQEVRRRRLHDYFIYFPTPPLLALHLLRWKMGQIWRLNWEGRGREVLPPTVNFPQYPSDVSQHPIPRKRQEKNSLLALRVSQGKVD